MPYQGCSTKHAAATIGAAKGEGTCVESAALPPLTSRWVHFHFRSEASSQLKFIVDIIGFQCVISLHNKDWFWSARREVHDVLFSFHLFPSQYSFFEYITVPTRVPISKNIDRTWLVDVLRDLQYDLQHSIEECCIEYFGSRSWKGVEFEISPANSQEVTVHSKKDADIL